MSSDTLASLTCLQFAYLHQPHAPLSPVWAPRQRWYCLRPWGSSSSILKYHCHHRWKLPNPHKTALAHCEQMLPHWISIFHFDQIQKIWTLDYAPGMFLPWAQVKPEMPSLAHRFLRGWKKLGVPLKADIDENEFEEQKMQVTEHRVDGATYKDNRVGYLPGWTTENSVTTSTWHSIDRKGINHRSESRGLPWEECLTRAEKLLQICASAIKHRFQQHTFPVCRHGSTK